VRVCLGVTVVVTICVVVTCGPGIVTRSVNVTGGCVYVVIFHFVVVAVVVDTDTVVTVTVAVGSTLLSAGVGVVTNGLGAGATLF
jgi:hypothetical protein